MEIAHSLGQFHHDFRRAHCKYVGQISTESIISKTLKHESHRKLLQQTH